MRRQRATLTERLSQVIEVIELGRRTGLLSVERDGAAGLEEGDIYFLNGQAIYASMGIQSGRSAFELLRTWGACRFAFLSDIPRPMPNIGPEPRNSGLLQSGSLRPGGTGPRPGADQFPRVGGTGPRPPAEPPPRSGPLAGPASGEQRSGPLPPSPPSARPLFSPDVRRDQWEKRSSPSLPRGRQPGEGASGGFPSRPSRLSGPAVVLDLYQRPRRAPNPQDIPRLAAAYHLSRAHRALLLLADGEHTVIELARLVGRSEEEALALLAELMQMGLVTLLS